MMDMEDLPKKAPAMVIGEPLDAISVAELEQRLELLRAEIQRIQAEVMKKQASKNAADAFFKK